MPRDKRRETQQGRRGRDEDRFVVVGLELSAEEFIAVPNVVIQHQRLSPEAKVLYCWLLYHEEGKGASGPRRGDCRVLADEQALATVPGMSRGAAVRHLNELIDAHFIARK